MSPDREWLSAPAELPLSGNEVHVWRASLGLPASTVQDMWRLLSADEMERARRFRFARHRKRFTAARGLLRLILGRYVGAPPERLRFCYGSHGKPSLAVEPGGTGLQFSVSHSSDLALYAVARARQVGIDVERIRLVPEARVLVEGYFSSAEQVAFRALPREEQLLAFFSCWTRKEAFIKARGQGLSLALDRFDVSLAPGEPARLLRVDGNPREASRWALRELSPAHDYVAALAVEGHGLRLSCWRWTG
jgi:4'-phosphopantetheinyl transferase